ncbi:MAG: hypothetical protein D6772_10795 [Bacteroidetes bacterium]|nr:MAG: hypothetical protein D6772_10795 [Bacteroidota bacterium]
MNKILLTAIMLLGAVLGYTQTGPALTGFVLETSYGQYEMLNDSTFRVNCYHPDSQIGQGYDPTDIQVGHLAVDGLNRLFRVANVVGTPTFASSTIDFVELQDRNEPPIGVNVIYERIGNTTLIPVGVQNSLGISPATAAKMHQHNVRETARLFGLVSVPTIYSSDNTIPDGRVATLEGAFSLLGEWSRMLLDAEFAELSAGGQNTRWGMQFSTGTAILGDISGNGARMELDGNLFQIETDGLQVQSRVGNVGVTADSAGLTLPDLPNAPSLVTGPDGRIGAGPNIPTTATQLPTNDPGNVYVGANNVEANLQEAGANILALDALLGNHLNADADLDSLNEIQTAAEVAAEPFGSVSATDVQGQLEQVANSVDLGDVYFVGKNGNDSTGKIGDFFNQFSSLDSLNSSDIQVIHTADTLLLNKPFYPPTDFVSTGEVIADVRVNSPIFTLLGNGESYSWEFNRLTLRGNSVFDKFLVREASVANGGLNDQFYLKAKTVTVDSSASIIIPGGTIEFDQVRVTDAASYVFWIGASKQKNASLLIKDVVIDNCNLLLSGGTHPGSPVDSNLNLRYSYILDNILIKKKGCLFYDEFSSSDRRLSSLIFKANNIIDSVIIDSTNETIMRKLADPYLRISGRPTQDTYPRLFAFGSDVSTSFFDTVQVTVDIANMRTDQSGQVYDSRYYNSDIRLSYGNALWRKAKGLSIESGSIGGNRQNRYYIHADNGKSLLNPCIALIYLDTSNRTEITGRWESINTPVIVSNQDFYLNNAQLYSDTFLIESQVPISVYTCNTNVTQERVHPNVTVIDVCNPAWKSETFTATAAQTDFVVSAGKLPTSGANVRLYNDSGAKLRETDHYTYTAAIGTVTLVTPATAGEKYTIEYYQ